MKHAREDYNRIQDPEGLIPEDEPVFLIRAKDVCAPSVVSHWASLAKEYGASPEIVIAARRQVMAMHEWQHEHGCQVPTLPGEPEQAAGEGELMEECKHCDSPGGPKTYANQVALPIRGRVEGIDYCIHHIVAALNAGGVTTVASCCGHGQRGSIMLEDGRELIIVPADQNRFSSTNTPTQENEDG